MTETIPIKRLEPFPQESVPLRFDGRSGYLVGQTRVPLDTVIGAYLDGATPEEIVRSYDVLDLADVHAVIAYYWRHRDAVHQHLTERDQEAKQLQEENRRRFPEDHAWARLRSLKRERSAL